VICFFLPFFHVSCSGQKIFDVTGFQLVTGTSVDKQMAESRGDRRMKVERNVESEILAQLAFLAAILGLVFALLRTGASKILQALAGAGGAVLLFLLKNKMGTDFTKESVNWTGINIGFDVGFWLALILFAAAFIVQLIPQTSPPQLSAGEEKQKESAGSPVSN
jgi:hypothetical protein